MKKLLLIVLPLLLMLGCEDTDVSDGVEGLTILVNSEEEPIGTNCSNGGTKLSFGGDSDGDGTLDDDEITNTFYVCNGNDGVSNLTSDIVQMSWSNTEYLDSDNNGDGYIKMEYSHSGITENVLQNGLVIVEYSPTNIPYDWRSLPLTLYNNENYDDDLHFDVFYHYTVPYEFNSIGSVTIIWDIKGWSDYDWWDTKKDDFWGKYYRITIIPPSES